ncbi:MAG: MBL fold metallo-hydrolase [Bacteroidales bacterium]|nr:MBL fold metallo-hydrolase [Bacteroidales bacterium]
MKRILIFTVLSLLMLSCGSKDSSSNTVVPGGGTAPIKSPETLGQPLSAWTEGTLDIHFINTTTGECTFVIFPDGTQMLVDAAGSLSATGAVGSTTNTGIRKRWDPTVDPDFRAGKFIVDYIKDCMEWTGNKKLDYVINTHFHSDHFGGCSSSLPASDLSSTYRKQSLPEVLDLLPAGLLLDRGWPSYDYPFDMQTKAANASAIRNYVTAVKWHVANKGLKAGMFKAGAADQIVMLRDPGAYPDFKVRNIAVNGNIWDGTEGGGFTATFPALKDISVANPAKVGNADNCPEENHCTTVFKLSYGRFDFFHGGDAQYDGCSSYAWKDMETAVAKASGAVDVMKADHHGVTNTNGYGYVAKNGHVCEAMNYLKPRCWIINSWTDGHPRQPVYEGVTNISQGMDVFITNSAAEMLSYARWRQVKGRDGHIVVRVEKGGAHYCIYTLSDSDGKKAVRQISGPYTSK